ncbi:MAG: hypothetical protein NMNS01_11630 [Nitrosomonas sp.]|nr:MAG: hypothetical protein NMNS01_11630 [Nitrosomonas sp.]
MDESYLWAAIRYVERNPVRAKIVTKAEEYPWSSAAMHRGLSVKDNEVLSKETDWKEQCEQIPDWSTWLAEGDDHQKLEMIRRNVEKDLPCGTEKFSAWLEKIAGRSLRYRLVGRPKSIKGSVPFYLLLPFTSSLIKKSNVHVVHIAQLV